LVVDGGCKLELLKQHASNDCEVAQQAHTLFGGTRSEFFDWNVADVLEFHVFGYMLRHVAPKRVPADRVLRGDAVETGASNPRRLDARTINVRANGARRAFAGWGTFWTRHRAPQLVCCWCVPLA